MGSGSGSPLLDFIEGLKKFLTESGKTSIIDIFDGQWYKVKRTPRTKTHRSIFTVRDIYPKD